MFFFHSLFLQGPYFYRVKRTQVVTVSTLEKKIFVLDNSTLFQDVFFLGQ